MTAVPATAAPPLAGLPRDSAGKLLPFRRPADAPPPYLSWCLCVRNTTKQHVRDEHSLADTLRSLRERSPLAEVVVVDTCSSDDTLKIAEPWADIMEVYRGPRGDWQESDYAVDDMAAARQRSFDLANGTWVCWVDADDVVLGGAEAEKYLRTNARWKNSHGKRGYDVKVADDVPGLEEEPAGLEDVLRAIEEKHPDCTQIRCPYLYRRDDAGQALVWQQRERFHLLGPRDEQGRRRSVFHWQEAAHEICVAVDRTKLSPNAELPHLLFLHQKLWSPQEAEFSTRRHGEIMLKAYEAGDRTHRRCFYLATFAPALWPARELEFLQASLECAYSDVDRSAALTALGIYYHKRGLSWESRSHFTAAIDMFGVAPDPYYAAGNAAVDLEDWLRAADCYKRGNACAFDDSCTHMAPRDHMIDYPSREAVALREAGKQAAEQGHQAQALTLLDQAQKLARAVLDKPEAKETEKDRVEAERLWLAAVNDYQHQVQAMTVYSAWEMLRKNDEPEKALALIDAFTWGSEDHQLRLQMEQWAHAIRKHKTDDDAYADFYAKDDHVTGYVPVSNECLTYEQAQPRIKWIVDRIVALEEATAGTRKGPLRVLDLGCCDGQIGIPLLLRLSEPLPSGTERLGAVRYHGVDVNPSALEHFKEHLAHFQLPTDQIELENGTWPAALVSPEDESTRFLRFYDVIVVGEIIEHVPDPAEWLWKVSTYLAPGGEILCTTPWGSFDLGVPPPTTWFGTPRDDRGHLRAYSPRRFLQDARDANLEVAQLVHLGRALNEPHWHQALVARLTSDAGLKLQQHSGLSYDQWSKRTEYTKKLQRPVAVVVPGALWKWNGSRVDREGMGASESMIVRMGEKLAAEGRRFDVFGPVPEEEVYNGVGYWKRDGARELDRLSPDAKVVVSRGPDYVLALDRQLGRELPPEQLVLWLQDTHYQSLNRAIAERYGTIVVVSEWAKRHTIEAHGLAGMEGKFRVAYNWANADLYRPGIEAGWAGHKNQTHFLYASSPDRGLIKLLELWPQVLQRIPEATLSIFYGWKGAAKLGAGADQGWNQRYLTSRRRYEELRFQKGVREIGLVNHYQVAIEMQRAGALAYPVHDFFETGCAAAVEAAAAGAVPVVAALGALEAETGNYAALPDQWNAAWDVDHRTGKWGEQAADQWLDALEASVGMSTEHRQALARESLARFSWEAVRSVWEEILS